MSDINVTLEDSAPINVILQEWFLIDIAVATTPPRNVFRVTNLYVDPNTGKLLVEYDNTLT